MFIDQLIDTDLKTMLKWKFIKIVGKESRRGPKPIWYKTIVKKLTTNGVKLKQNWEDLTWIKNNLAFNGEITRDKRKKEWCCSLDRNNNVVWGRIQEKRGGEITVKHYISKDGGNESTKFTQCQDCSNKNVQATTGSCLFKTRRKNLIGCKYLNDNKTLKYNGIIILCNTFTLENSAKEGLTQIGSDCNKNIGPVLVTIEPWEIENIRLLINSEAHKQELIIAYKDNANKAVGESHIRYEFYTDGSMYKRGQQEITMGQPGYKSKVPTQEAGMLWE